MDMTSETYLPRVLLVDDDRRMRDLLTQTLTEEGYIVISAADGEEALSRLMSFRRPVDLVITDVRMPKATGMELLERIRTSDWYTAVIVISAFADDDVQAEATRLGAVSVLAKPFSLNRFLDAVRDALSAM